MPQIPRRPEGQPYEKCGLGQRGHPGPSFLLRSWPSRQVKPRTKSAVESPADLPFRLGAGQIDCPWISRTEPAPEAPPRPAAAVDESFWRVLTVARPHANR